MLFIGETAAIAAAIIWAIASIAYARLGQKFDPMGLNFAKGVVAIALLLCTPTLWFQDWTTLQTPSAALLFLSGIFGIGLGDTFFFEMLKALGPRKTLLLDALTPTITAALAWVFLKENLSFASCWGIALTFALVGERRVEWSPQGVAVPRRQALQLLGMTALILALCLLLDRSQGL